MFVKKYEGLHLNIFLINKYILHSLHPGKLIKSKSLEDLPDWLSGRPLKLGQIVCVDYIAVKSQTAPKI